MGASSSLACGNGVVAPPSAAPATAASESVGVHVPWVKMTRGQRLDYMIKTVMPTTKAMFVAFDPKRFDRMDCATCHGEGVEDTSFSLPNAALPKLLEPDLFAKHRAATPEITKFMLEQVEPKMAALLEVPDFDPATRKGLSCYLCHTRDPESAKPLPPPAEHF